MGEPPSRTGWEREKHWGVGGGGERGEGGKGKKGKKANGQTNIYGQASRVKRD